MEELLKQLCESLPAQNGVEGATSHEMAKALGWPFSRVMDRLKAGIEEGKIVCSGKKRVMGIDGAMHLSPMYRVKKEGE
jgi:hypothetical protein